MNIYTDHKYMTNEMLRRYHRQLQFRRNVWITIPWALLLPALLIYGIIGWSTYPEVMLYAKNGYHADPAVFGVISWILFAVLTVFLPIQDKNEGRRFASAIFMGAYTLLRLLFGYFSPISLLMIAYYVVAPILLEPVRKELIFIRSLPGFPFFEREEQDRLTEESVAEFYEKPSEKQTPEILSEPTRDFASSEAEEAVSHLPQKHIEELYISRGLFDEPEQTYSDKLINEQERDRLARQEQIDEISDDFRGDF